MREEASVKKWLLRVVPWGIASLFFGFIAFLWVINSLYKEQLTKSVEENQRLSQMIANLQYSVMQYSNQNLILSESNAVLWSNNAFLITNNQAVIENDSK